jgi:glycosyltransferase involved in cell wall biosynthesis
VGDWVKVLYLISVLAPAGAEQSLVAMAPSLTKLGVHLKVAYLKERAGLHHKLEEAGFEVVALSGSGRAPGRLLRTCRLLRADRPDLLHTTLTEANIIGRLAGWMTGVPTVSSLVNVSYGPEQRASPASSTIGVTSRHLLDLATAPFVARFHAVTSTVADVMADRLRVPRERIEVVPRGRDAEHLGRRHERRRTATRSQLGADDGVPLVLAVAHQDYQKGLDLLVEAMALVRRERSDARLLVAGRRGNHSEALQERAAHLGLHDAVDFLGLRNDVAELLCAADVFVLASRWEGMGGVLLEAMALEAPMVVSDLPTLRDAVPDELHGLLVAPNQPEALAAGILEVLADPGKATERARRARQRFVERFTTERVAEEMLGFYERALAVARPPEPVTRGRRGSTLGRQSSNE